MWGQGIIFLQRWINQSSKEACKPLAHSNPPPKTVWQLIIQAKEPNIQDLVGLLNYLVPVLK
jgi:hypothetical protein